jgi:hypothetical protein
MYAASSRVCSARATESSDLMYASDGCIVVSKARRRMIKAYFFDRDNPRYVHIHNLEAIVYSPVNVPLGYISLRAQSQRLYSARLHVLTSQVLWSSLLPVTGSGLSRKLGGS